jgi:hypothetical protein
VVPSQRLLPRLDISDIVCVSVRIIRLIILPLQHQFVRGFESVSALNDFSSSLATF